MYIRRITTRRTASGQTYHSYRLVESRREGGRVRQIARSTSVQRRVTARFTQRMAAP